MANSGETADRVRELLDRLTRLHASESRSDDLNPTQVAALGYLLRANRFSRSPSQVAEYLSATRGTVSQTLKSLQRKGLIEEQRSEADRRSISYAVTGGQAEPETGVLGQVPEAVLEAASASLEALLSALLAARGGRSFGLCRTCRHHRSGNDGARCALLDVSLGPAQIDLICYEHEPPHPATDLES